jgi:hypothetical protein
MKQLIEKRNQGDLVYFDTGALSGFGKICGQATTGSPVIGISWIVELSEGTKAKLPDHPFTHITVFDCMIKD